MASPSLHRTLAPQVRRSARTLEAACTLLVPLALGDINDIYPQWVGLPSPVGQEPCLSATFERRAGMLVRHEAARGAPRAPRRHDPARNVGRPVRPARAAGACPLPLFEPGR